MKTFSFAVSSLLLTFGDVAAQVDGTSSQLLRRAQSNKNRRASKNPCVVILSDKEYLDHHVEDQPLECELQSTDVVKANGIMIDDDTDELIIPTGETIELGRRNKSSGGSSKATGAGSLDPADLIWNRNLATVVKKVLVLRIQAADASTTASETQLADDVFGAAGDVLNLKSQFNQCSYGQLQFEPTTSNALVGTDGVYTVTLPTTIITGAADNPIAWAAVDKATAELGTLTNFADHVMVCMPPGTSGGWIAYAYINHWLSVFNNQWCGYPSGLLHELGHNLNLAHSSEGSTEYGDQSGLMGYSYGNDDGPIMCFNGPKTWQLGWFSEYHVDLSTATGISWSGNLVGFAQRANAAVTDKMIIRIQSSSTDTYVSFNRRIGINSGTQEGADQVLVVTRAPGTGYALSNLVAKLSASGIYTVPNFNGSTNTLRITVNSIVTSTTPARATVTIDLVAQTAAPTNAPTNAPTRAPTLSPTPVPTQSPTQAPTLSPTDLPTLAPTGVPTPAPPTDAPTPAAPTDAPTPAPPTDAPTQTPTDHQQKRRPNHPPFLPPKRRPNLPRYLQHKRRPENPRYLPHRRRPEHPHFLPRPPTGAPTFPPRPPTGAPTLSPTRAPTGAPLVSLHRVQRLVLRRLVLRRLEHLRRDPQLVHQQRNQETNLSSLVIRNC
ncbi:Gametolysin peptidase M11 [Fragilaria crotonensis]|nr:Gametolysin peptidase M11 [Fragilaria crotonensis]